MPIVRRTRADVDLKSVNWAAVDATSDADIERQNALDPALAVPEMTDDELKTARRVTPEISKSETTRRAL